MTNNAAAASAVKAPAIGLMVTGALNILTGIYLVASALLQWKAGALERTFINDGERIGFYAGFWGLTALGILSALLAFVVIYGAVQMLNGKSYGLAKTAAILAVIPLTSCCFVSGLVCGIWALVVLSKPEIKTYFQQQSGAPTAGQ